MEMKIRDVLLLVLAFVVIGAIGMALPVHAATDDPGITGQTMVNPQWEARTDAGAHVIALEAEWCPGVASTTLVAAKYLSGAKSLYIQNRSSATCYVSFDASAATTAGGRGFKWAAGDERSFDVSGTTFGSRMRAACTATLTANACLWLNWFK